MIASIPAEPGLCSQVAPAIMDTACGEVFFHLFLRASDSDCRSTTHDVPNKIPLEIPRRFSLPNAGLNVFSVDGSNWQLQLWGDTGHLTR